MARIEHVVVVALENRSFDHMLGYLHHPDPRFDGLAGDAPHTNPGWDGAAPVPTTTGAKAVLPLDPDHSHDAVMDQLCPGDDGEPTMQGFVSSYERRARGLAPPRWGGLLGPLMGWWLRRHAPHPVPGCGPLIMACQPEDHVPALAALARGFGVCTRWFASVPGETWPNRGFMHAATSDGDTDIQFRLYRNRTVFEQLEAAGRDWHIYFDDLPMACVLADLWDEPDRLANWFGYDAFARHVAEGRLPAYSFIEPNHRPPIHLPGRSRSGSPASAGSTGSSRGSHGSRGSSPRSASDSQHPANGLVASLADYEAWAPGTPTDFSRGDALLADVYETLRGDADLFERTVLLITYDEAGGFYDHVPPPRCPAPGDHASLGRTLQRLLLDRRSRRFDFTRLGPRVPAVVVSPYVRPATVCGQVRDHASIPATVRRLLAPGQPALTARDAAAVPFDTLLDLDSPPRREDLPDLSAVATGLRAAPAASATPVGPSPVPAGGGRSVPDHDRDLAVLARRVRRRLKKRGVRAAWWPPLVRPVNRPTRAAAALGEAADRSRRRRTAAAAGPAGPTDPSGESPTTSPTP